MNPFCLFFIQVVATCGEKISFEWGINSELFTTCEFNEFNYLHAPVIKSLQSVIALNLMA